MKNWIDHDVYEEVEDKGQNYISVRWVMTEKTSDGKQIVKARLVGKIGKAATLSILKDGAGSQ